MNFTELYSNACSDAAEIINELENFGHSDPLRLVEERAYARGVETYFATAFEMVDALRGDGHLFDDAEDAAREHLQYLEVNFRDWVYRIAFEGYRLLLLEQLERRGVQI